ncbi:enoyl-CoA hydratase/isomerase family protein [Salinisphaera sp. Q1T1-3]|uniref:enoyl-CoA hydratase/isomerase family protein n=1 Tax=Salinisphaera sp. Q1T1-3 TaxID=2321229 RepID=UPI000E737878|nr:enoyl-CoA hydratase-related protein [Salinisphaera sp. Q1T1-3]RJS91421.1 enoyl-CoA hydratase [Salinisphaera sp. Q1T1-3]
MPQLPDPTSGHVRLDLDDSVLHIHLARADKRNALTQAMYTDLTQAIDFAAQATSVRVVCLVGDGDMFCAGNDIADFADIDPADGAAGVDGPALTFVRHLSQCDKPVVVAVQGQATGIGTTLLLHADLVVAADDARFYTAFIDLALVPEAGSSTLLPALIGRQQANRLLLAGDTLSAEEALATGLVAYVVPRASLSAKTAELTARLAAKSPGATAATKQLLRAGRGDAPLEAQIAREAELFGQRLASDEVAAVMRHFLDKRARH